MQSSWKLEYRKHVELEDEDSWGATDYEEGKFYPFGNLIDIAYKLCLAMDKSYSAWPLEDTELVEVDPDKLVDYELDIWYNVIKNGN